MSRNHNKPINAPDEEAGRFYVKLLEDLLTVFDAGTAQVLEYWLDNALFSGYRRPPVKVPFSREVMEEDVRFYAGLGIETVKSFGSYIGSEYARLHGVPPIKEYGGVLYPQPTAY
jgi:hypothetical protein